MDPPGVWVGASKLEFRALAIAGVKDFAVSGLRFRALDVLLQIM